MADVWQKHREVWKNKPLLRQIYTEWYERIVSDMTKGKTLEIGSGTGNFKEYYPNTITSDVVKLPGIDLKFDATKIPFKKNALGNIVLIDTLHHLPNPVRFLHEAYRVLKPGGRIIMLEPYPSLLSLPIYKIFHKEPFIFNINYYSKFEAQKKKPWDSNQAIPYLLFFKQKDDFENLFSGKLKITEKNLLSFFRYPLSGGFEGKQLVPDALVPLVSRIEIILSLGKQYLAFRCYIVLERI